MPSPWHTWTWLTTKFTGPSSGPKCNGSSSGPKCNGSFVRTISLGSAQDQRLIGPSIWLDPREMSMDARPRYLWCCTRTQFSWVWRQDLRLRGPSDWTQNLWVLQHDLIFLGLRQDLLACTARLCSADSGACGLQPPVPGSLQTCQTRGEQKNR